MASSWPNAGHFRRLHVPSPEKKDAKPSVSKDFRLKLVGFGDWYRPNARRKAHAFRPAAPHAVQQRRRQPSWQWIELEDGTTA